MEKEYAIRWTVLGTFAALAILATVWCLGYAKGAAVNERIHQLAVDNIRADYSASEKQLREQLANTTRELDDVKSRTDRIGSGLATAVDIAGRATDRTIRIAVLIDAIDRALCELGTSLDK